MTIGGPLVRWRWAVLATWLAAIVAFALFAPWIDPSANERTSFLPDHTPYSRGVRAMQRFFPDNSGLSKAAVVFERKEGGLTRDDLDTVERVAAKIRTPGAVADEQDLAGIQVRSPKSVPLSENPFKSPLTAEGQAALIVVNIPANFITIRSRRVVDHIYAVLREYPLPDGLKVAVTGNSGFGRDYADAAERSHSRTVYVTLAAVIVILMLVYRAPIAAVVPLVAISAAAFVALKTLAVAQHFGMHVGTAEKIFVVVLLYGAGTDYSLFFLSRFREYLEEPRPSQAAAGAALDATLPAILASAGTDTVGLLMLCFAQYGVFKTTGPAVAVALLVAFLAAVTLVPVLAAIVGRRLFWPRKSTSGNARKLLGFGRRKFWPFVARAVTARPGTVLVVALAALAVPAWRGAHMTWVYDTLTASDRNEQARIGNAAVGIDVARRHWPVGEIAPVQVLVESDSPLAEKDWQALSEKLTRALSELEGVRVVRSLSRPIGKAHSALTGAILKTLGRSKVRAEYLSKGGSAMRLSVVLNSPAFSLASMEAARRIRGAALSELSGNPETAAPGPRWRVHLTGATAEMIDIRAVTQSDFHIVAALCLGAIFLMVLLLLRDAILSAFMVASTVLSYFATLGVAYWVFTGLLGQEGLDWKVEVFVFVVMVAVGVDYNIFLAWRLAQEARRLEPKLAVCRAMIHTGPVISSCGLIMATTLGSLMAGDLQLLRQLGFTLATGMLIDTFLVRPLLLPAFAAKARRTGKALNFAR